jgi:hypothetical protein|mmetsp:Transcript_63/g.140  ORF Transcript_63/g.140 Transcript_63/m.140 type:complete len:228 (-) Transcript_63:156-839(-)
MALIVAVSQLGFAPAGPALPVVSSPKTAAPAALMSAAKDLEGAAHETGFEVWDPVGFADLGSPATLAWFRHAELKHGRVCMAAFVGWLVAVSGIHFPGLCSFSEGVSFEDLSKLAPLEQWSALPALGKAQILLAIGIIEHQSEWKIKPHYMKGGVPGSLKGLKSFWDPVGFTSKLDAAKLERQRLCEIKNGRAAMLGITSVLIANYIPGSIPLPITFPDASPIVLPF